MNDPLIHFNVKGDFRGSLVALEELREIPFTIKRVYYIYDIGTGAMRGEHAHYTNRQIAVALKGSCRFCMDDGRERQSFLIDRPQLGIFIDAMVWHYMYDFSDDVVLMVLASDYYDDRDYIRSYDTFMKEIGR